MELKFGLTFKTIELKVEELIRLPLTYLKGTGETDRKS